MSSDLAMACVVCPGRSEFTLSTTPTDATGAGVTVTIASAVRPSATAEIVAVPTLSPTTTPDDDTVAIDGTRLVHVKARPLNVPPCASVATAERVVDWPTMTLAVAGVIAIAAIGAGDTVIVDEAEAPATAPKIVAVPGATALTRPVVETVATPAALVVHVTVDVSAAVQFVAVALVASCWLDPTASDAAAGLTLTDVTAQGFVCSLQLARIAISGTAAARNRQAVGPRLRRGVAWERLNACVRMVWIGRGGPLRARYGRAESHQRCTA